jgi:hypothetical protein
MKITNWTKLVLLSGVFGALAAGCAVGPGGYGYDNNVGVGIGADYYEPYYGDYGGWGPGYRVGPPRGDGHDRNTGGLRGSPSSYRPAPASRPTPSIPSRGRPGGGPSGNSGRR